MLWTDWADIFCGHSWVAGECYRLKKRKLFFSKFFFSNSFFLRALQVAFNIKKQGIRTYVLYRRPNGWTDWAEIFADTHGWPGDVSGSKNSKLKKSFATNSNFKISIFSTRRCKSLKLKLRIFNPTFIV